MNVVAALAWVAVGAMAAALGAVLAGWVGNRLMVTLLAAVPYLFALAVPIGIGAVVTGRWPLAAAAGGVGVVFVPLCWRLLRPPPQRQPADGRRLRVFFGNLLYFNGRTAELARAVASFDADVLAFTEYTQTHAGGLYVAPLAATYPYRIEQPEARAGGSAIWSRLPLTAVSTPPARFSSSAAAVGADDPITVFVVHPPNPLQDLQDWLDEHARLAALRSTVDAPTIVVGDFNATFWHPPFRRLLAAGWRDAHRQMRRAFSASWPADGRWLPAFLRLDHALVDDSIVVLDVRDVEIPGSDHRGFVLDIAISP